MESLDASYISAYSSLILVFATIIYVLFTYKLFAETKKLREVETSPFISLEIEPYQGTQHLALKIKNIGKAPAYNISFEIEEKYKDIFRYNFDNKISYFAPGQEIESFGKQYREFINLEVENIPINVVYFSKENSKIEETFLLEWEQLDGLLLEKDALSEIEKHLKVISEEIKKQTNLIKKSHSISRISILEIEKNSFYFKCIFNNGYIGKIEKDKIYKLGLSDINNVELDGSELYDRNLHLVFKSEEIYNKFLKLEESKLNYKKSFNISKRFYI